MGQAQINVRTRACSRTSIARTRQAALTHNVRGKELNNQVICFWKVAVIHVEFHDVDNGCVAPPLPGIFIMNV